ncbi:MAG: hypothetical protein K2I84_03070 [Bacteroidales bacterium]|nr:hypothetical protein [Bacteroidales bacterium]
MKNKGCRWLLGLLMLGLPGLESVSAAGSFYELKRSDVAFHAGAAFPLGKFGQAPFGRIDYNNRTLDCNGAKIGVTYGVAFDFYVFNEYCGLFITFQGHSNKTAAPAEAFGPDPATTLGKQVWTTDETDKWTEFMAMAGGTFRFPLVDWLVGTGRVGIGYAHMLSPFYRSTSDDPYRHLHYTYDFSSGSKPAFGYAVGLGLKFLVTRGFHIDLKADYMGSTPFNFANTEAMVYVESKSKPEDGKAEVKGTQTAYSFKETFSVVDLSLGFTIAF